MNSDAPERSLAAVDLGSNSFHLLVARLRDGEPRRVDRVRERVALAAGLDERRRLDEETRARALACLERFGQRLAGLAPADVRAVGTSAIRQARDADRFLAEAERALGHRIEVISGAEEARLIYLGVAHDLAVGDARRLVVDIGGGSTECIVGERFEPLEAHSLHMGCIAWSRRFFGDGKLRAKRFEKARLAARRELEGLEGRFGELGWQGCVGSSGTVLAVRRILVESGWDGDGITPDGLARLERALVAARRVEALDLPGLSAERRPVIAGGLAILEAVFEAFEVERMQASEFALREGLVYDLVGRIRDEDVRERTADYLAERFGVDRAQARRVERTALALFEGVRERWRLGEEERRFLRWSARLHEIGLAVAWSGHHRHGAYLLDHAVMPGFTRRGQRLLAAVVLSHRRRLSRERIEAVAEERDLELALRLALLLRLAVVLHRPRVSGDVPVRARATKRGLTLEFDAAWLAARPLTREDLAEEVRRQAEAGYVLEIVESGAEGPAAPDRAGRE